jgi:hypothetical protein
MHTCKQQQHQKQQVNRRTHESGHTPTLRHPLAFCLPPHTCHKMLASGSKRLTCTRAGRVMSMCAASRQLWQRELQAPQRHQAAGCTDHWHQRPRHDSVSDKQQQQTLQVKETSGTRPAGCTARWQLLM